MEATIKQAWVNALRSGKYKQGQGDLRKNDLYCCLGVACELSGLGEWSKPDESSGVFGYMIGYDIRHGTLPIAMQHMYALDDLGTIMDFVTRDEDRITLAGMNDSNFNFNQIADMIQYFF